MAFWQREPHLIAMVGYPDRDSDGMAFVITDQNTGQEVGSSFAVQQALVIAYNGVPDGRLSFDQTAHQQAAQVSSAEWTPLRDGVVLGAPVPGWRRDWGAYVIRVFAHPPVLAAVVPERTGDRHPSPAIVDVGDAADRLPLRDPGALRPPRQR